MQSFLENMHSRSERIAARANSLSRRCGEESLHQFRVEIKRLRAGFRLLRAVDPSFPYRKRYLRYKNLFATGGIVREIQLELQLLETDKKADPVFRSFYRRYLNKRYRLARETFRSKARRTHFQNWDMLEEVLAPAVSRCRPERLDRYFEETRQRIEHHLKNINNCSEEEVHDLRKALKDYEANRKTMLRFFGADPGPLPFLPANVDTLLDQIGEWHDYLVASRHLKNDLKTESWPKETNAAGQKLLARWQRKYRKLRNKLNKLKP